MAGEKKIYRYKAGEGGSSVQTENVQVSSIREGVVLRGANNILGKLSFTKNSFEHWPTWRRIVIGYALWVVIIPIWPIAVLASVVNNPAIPRKTFIVVLLAIVAVGWFWLLYSIISVFI